MTTFAPAACWSLIRLDEHDQLLDSTEITEFPFLIGRGLDSTFRVDSTTVSKVHAKLKFEDGLLLVEDLGSTNGTYVNGEQVVRARLEVDDIVQFGGEVFRVGGPGYSAIVISDPLEIRQLLVERAVVPNFQPIVTICRDGVIGFEILGRSSQPALESIHTPQVMFDAAREADLVLELSQLLREEGIQVAASSQKHNARFFMNIHPAELGTDRLDDALQAIRRNHPNMKLTLEVPEPAIHDLSFVQELKSQLTDLRMEMAYDDFSSDRTRLRELAQAPANVLKFDIPQFNGILQKGKEQELLRDLVKCAIDMGMIPLAEGIETKVEHQVCTELGFKWAQGFLLGRPAMFD